MPTDEATRPPAVSSRSAPVKHCVLSAAAVRGPPLGGRLSRLPQPVLRLQGAEPPPSPMRRLNMCFFPIRDLHPTCVYPGFPLCTPDSTDNQPPGDTERNCQPGLAAACPKGPHEASAFAPQGSPSLETGPVPTDTCDAFSVCSPLAAEIRSVSGSPNPLATVVPQSAAACLRTAAASAENLMCSFANGTRGKNAEA
jgi:hypothetical protein